MMKFDEVHLIVNKLPSDIALDIVIMGCWGIWMSINDKIFRMATHTQDTWKYYLKEGLQAT